MSQGSTLLAVSVTSTIIALATCGLRCWVKMRDGRAIVWDDYFIGLAMLLGMVGSFFTIVECLNQDYTQTATQFNYLAQPWLSMGSTLSKVSICLFFLRHVSKIKAWRAVLGIQILLLLVVNLVYSLAILLQCRPLEKLWNSSANGECWSISVQQNIGYVQGGFDVFSEFFITLFPIMIIQDLGIRRNLRYPFYVLSSTGIVIGVLAVARIYNISLTSSSSRYVYQLSCTILKVLEQNLGILAANILPTASLFSNVGPISEAFNQAEIGRTNSDTISILPRSKSTASRSIRSLKRQSTGSSFVVEGPERGSFDGQSIVGYDTESWPLGIIKTVSVQVTEEQAVELKRGTDGSMDGRPSGDQKWDSYYR
ncbi:uncharacterized protein BCR38DRAFT_490804 [Pseudomassariella vexata]|uniref:Rhodopsin domain-containing protein n=1 Tax=Pseudomassariella vexata TaxID=1141098 RepID=A0A1Y2DA48_9PEZI|nr:uncharacterized protein BCR38DRAFT_490804 [Pseudomassariella vexata]ORY56148.1 hypothetical protein BCR38DRAFT_490804 [Pseudomassariella vexata]